MIKLILSGIVSICSMTLYAQSSTGIFFQLNGGAALHFSPSLQQSLRGQTLLGADFHFNRTAPLAGADVFIVLPNRLLLGAGITGYRIVGSTHRGDVSLTKQAGSVKVGYRLTSARNLFSFPYVGAGVNSMNLKIGNNVNGEEMNLRDLTILPGMYKRFESQGINFEAGYSLQYIAALKQDRMAKSGLLIGMQIGALIFASLEDWQEVSSKLKVPSLAQQLSFSPFIRITIGLGVFRAKGNVNYYKQ